jgi:hypothetical protein
VPPARAWKAVRGPARDSAEVALFAGAAAYLATCLTGHPLLVPEASFPFWIALGVVAAIPAHRDDARTSRGQVPLLVLAGLGLAVMAVQHVRPYAADGTAPPGFGFYEEEVLEDDGTRFRWMTRHAVSYHDGGQGFLRLTVRAPERQRDDARPFVIETAVGGRVRDRRELPFGEWVTYLVAVRDDDAMAFRRVDLRLNQVDVPADRRRGAGGAQRPLGVMVGEIRWIDLADVAG